jgi:Subtilisin inhibitor-like
VRIAILVVAAAAAAGCAAGQMPSSGTRTVVKPGARTALGISTWRRGTDGPVRAWTLRCPPGGTLPNAARACSRLDALGAKAFKPVPHNVACTEIYGGPQVAEVRGTFNGRSIKARFTRANGCEIDRWDRHRFLFPIGT